MKIVYPALMALAFAFAPPAMMPVAAASAHAPSRVAEEEEITPNDPIDFTVRWDKAESGFRISFTAPTKGYVYDYENWTTVEKDLIKLTSINVQYKDPSEGWSAEWNTIKIIENPELGASYSFVDTSAPKGKDLTFRAVACNGSETSNGSNNVSCFGGIKPGKVTDGNAVTTLGQEPVTLTFKAPLTSSEGDELESLDHIKIYTKYYDYSIYDYVYENYGTVQPVTPGQECSYTLQDKNLSNGRNVVYVKAVSSEGEGDETEITFYIGTDTPGYVRNLKVVEQDDGSYLLTWEAPDKGANNGWFDASTLKYTVEKRVSGAYPYPVLTTDLTECRYTYIPEADAQEVIKLAVIAVNSTGTGSALETDNIIVGPALTLPFSETFSAKDPYNSPTSDHLWTNSNNAGESYAQFYVAATTYTEKNVTISAQGEGAMAYMRPYGSYNNGSYYYNSSKIDVSSTEYLELSFNYFNVGNSDMSLEAQISFDGAEPVTLKSISFKEAPVSEEWMTASGGISVPSGAKNAVLSFAAVKSGSKTETIAFDDIILRSADAPAKIYPASVSEFEAVYSKTEHTITVTGLAPTMSHATLGEVHNQPLTEISCIKLYRRVGMGTDDVLVHTWNPQPGDRLEYVDNKLEEYGEYSYKAVTYIGECCDYGQFLDEPVLVGQIPNAINDLTLTTNKGQAPVTLTFTVPDTDTAGDPLDEVLKITVERYDAVDIKWVSVTELTEGLVPGHEMSCEDPGVTVGEVYQYRLTTYGTAGSTMGTLKSVFVGIDQPIAPANVKAEVNSDGTVTVTWDVPTGGINNGYIDLDNITYTVQRGNGYSDYDAVPLEAGVTGTTYVDDTAFEDEEAVKYFVKATSLGITGYSGISNVLVVGNPSALPFTEDFEARWDGNVSADHTTWTIQSSEASGVWAFAEMAYSMHEGQILPQNGNGLAYAYYGPASAAERDDYLTSGNIDISQAQQPVVDFWMYGVPEYDTTLALDVAFDRGEFSEVHKVYYRNIETIGWTLVSCPVTPPQGATTMSIRFHAHKGASSCSAVIDNIRVYDKEMGGNAVIEAGKLIVTSAGGAITVSGAGDSEVTIVNLAGIEVARQRGDFSVSVAPGIYIVKAPGHEGVKVAVK